MSTNATTEPRPAPPAETLEVKVNGRSITVPKVTPDWQGRPAPTTMIHACEAAGVSVPHYCYHRHLPTAGNCRMCLVEFGLPALGPDRKPMLHPDGSPKINRSPRPAISCATPVSPGMEIYTDTPTVRAMREGVLEFLLINHPLDCPICDQAGECKLQEYSAEFGQTQSCFAEAKVHKPKQVDLGPRILFDAERCILCTRCLRFTRDIVRDDVLGIVNRGSYNTIATYPGRAFDHNYTLNTVDLCPVGALTSKDFRFRMRVWFLKETRSLCTRCGTGCNVLIGSRENQIYRQVPRENAAVNGCWMCDAGRLDYQWIGREDRLREVRGPQAAGPIGPMDWHAALAEIMERLRGVAPGSVALVASARQTNEELFLVRQLALKLGALTDSVPRRGESDLLLVCSDRNPNSLGAQINGISARPAGSNLPRIAEGIRTGAIRTLIVLGEDVTRHGIPAELLDKLSLLVVSDILPNETTRRAHYLLPGCAHAEKQGTFTNVGGQLQRFWPAVEPPGQARPEIEFLAGLAPGGPSHEMPVTAEGVFARMAAVVPAFQGLTWAGLGDTGVTVPYTHEP